MNSFYILMIHPFFPSIVVYGTKHPKMEGDENLKTQNNDEIFFTTEWNNIFNSQYIEN